MGIEFARESTHCCRLQIIIFKIKIGLSRKWNLPDVNSKNVYTLFMSLLMRRLSAKKHCIQVMKDLDLLDSRIIPCMGRSPAGTKVSYVKSNFFDALSSNVAPSFWHWWHQKHTQPVFLPFCHSAVTSFKLQPKETSPGINSFAWTYVLGGAEVADADCHFCVSHFFIKLTSSFCRKKLLVVQWNCAAAVSPTHIVFSPKLSALINLS